MRRISQCEKIEGFSVFSPKKQKCLWADVYFDWKPFLQFIYLFVPTLKGSGSSRSKPKPEPNLFPKSNKPNLNFTFNWVGSHGFGLNATQAAPLYRDANGSNRRWNHGVSRFRSLPFQYVQMDQNLTMCDESDWYQVNPKINMLYFQAGLIS